MSSPNGSSGNFTNNNSNKPPSFGTKPVTRDKFSEGSSNNTRSPKPPGNPKK